MRLQINPEAKEVSFRIHPSLYGEDAVRVAAHIFERRAEVYVEKKARSTELTLAARRSNSDLEALGREFLNELLNQEYRKMVGSLNKNLAAMLVTQALYSARGGETEPKPAALTPEQKTEVRRLMEEAQEEIDRTMPKRIAPQGPPIPQEAE